jgi:prepilin-type N-terminal cleavage/methylation domain-containing protein
MTKSFRSYYERSLNNIRSLKLMNQRGVSLVEVMIALGIATILGYAVTRMQATQIMSNLNNQAVITAQDLKVRIGMLLKDNQTWTNIVVQNSTGGVNSAGGMDCLALQSTCVARAGSPLAFKLYTQTGTTAQFESYTTGGTNQPGFTLTGQPCNEFNDTAAGDRLCVFGYQLTWEVDNPCAGTCLNPPVKIVANLKHRPLPGILKINEAKYSYTSTSPFWRSGVPTLLNWTVEHIVPAPALGNCVDASGGGGGICSLAAGGAPRVLTTRVSPSPGDPFGLLSGSGTTTITVNATGTFSCTHTSYSFAGGNFSSYLKVNGAVVSTGSGTAALWTPSPPPATGTAIFTITTAPFTMQLLQQCSALPGGTPNADYCTLGQPATPYSGFNVYALVTCTSVL